MFRPTQQELLPSLSFILSCDPVEKKEPEMQCVISCCKSSHQLLSIKGNRREEEPFNHQSWRPSLQCFTSPLMAMTAAAILTLSSPTFIAPPAALAQSVPRGAALFQKSCIGCHDTGGNILQPGATLFMKDLLRNGVATEDEIYNITYYGKGRMPGFGEKCTPRGQCTFGPRLQDDEIKLLAEFVKSQAEDGWPNIQNYGD